MPEKIALITPDPDVRRAYAEFLARWGNFQLAISATSYEHFAEELKRLKVKLDCVLCDIDLPEKTAIEAIACIKSRDSDLPVMILSTVEHEDKVFQALCVGATGYVLKSTLIEKVAEGIHELINGGAVISPVFALKVAQFFSNATQGDPKTERRNKQEKLTIREVEVLTLLQQGSSNKQIAESLFISLDTVKYHTRNIYSKMHITCRKELFMKYHGHFN